MTANDLARRAERLLAGELDLVAQTSKVSVFRSRDGREMALERSRRLAIYVWVGHYEGFIPGVLPKNERFPGLPYEACQPRASSLKHNAPTLSVGHRAWHLQIADVDALRKFVRWFTVPGKRP